ncbi:MAG: hypothetical protein Q8J62_05425 [Candidatus Cloacimonadaceae bacterium]|nr:hypothetical protein [Candidatus Cloacimonadaceae bacterium]
MEPNPQGEDTITYFEEKDFEKRFYSRNTNITLCRAFMENAMYDPISGEIGKSIIFTVSQKHAIEIATNTDSQLPCSATVRL